jgi:hypothetical protein
MTGADSSISGTNWIHFHSWFHYSGNHNDAICFSIFVTSDVWLERLSMLRIVAFWMKDRKFKTKCFGQITNRPLFIHPDFERAHNFQGDLHDWVKVSSADKEKLTWVIQKVHWRSWHNGR